MNMHRFLDGVYTFYDVVGYLALFIIWVGLIAGIVIAILN